MTLRKRHPKTTESANKVHHYMTNDFVKTVFSSPLMTNSVALTSVANVVLCDANIDIGVVIDQYEPNG